MITAKHFNPLPVLLTFLSFISIVLLSSCKNYHRNNAYPNVSLSSIRQGEALAIRYCQSCHMLPDPSLLDTKSWEKGVLPAMGPRLGIFQFGFQNYPSFKTDRNLDSNFYPSNPLVTIEEWQNILNYYVATSPDTLACQIKQPVKNELSLFTILLPPGKFYNPAIAYVKINSEDSLHPLIISDALKEKIYLHNRQLEVIDSIHSNGPVVNIDFNGKQMLACNIGILNPNNGKFGKGYIINMASNGKMLQDTMVLFDSLQRPVQLSAADLNNDGKNDYLLCEFGNLTGALSWIENTKKDSFIKHVLRPFPGAIKTYINDYNHDGLLDIWALFTQGEEGIFLYTNKGNGKFQQEEILRFSPANGSSYFELADFNNDGYPDIVYTCGDNADYSPVLKPFHGVYIFLNDKSNHFKQQYFFPIHGCYKAIARDFDDDGDLDIAAISFFADYTRQPEEGFVYLENEGNYKFQPLSHPATQVGRWLTMDVGDINGDGKLDLILGNFSVGPSLRKRAIDWKSGPPFIILENIGKKH